MRPNSGTGGPATVYATLNEFCRHGLIKRLEFDRMENRYELSLEEHVNLVCRACGVILDVGVLFSFDQEATGRETGFQVMEKRLEYYGLRREERGDEDKKKYSSGEEDERRECNKREEVTYG